jgi:anti-anti-sigma regulatory factor
MATISDWLKIDGEQVLQSLSAVSERLNAADGELVLDFTAVRRIDAGAITAMEALAGKSKEKSVKVVLRGVNVEIYKVLKLSRLTTRFAFLT